MLTPKLQILERTLKRLLRRSASSSLENLLSKTHYADLGFILPHFSTSEQVKLIDLLENDEIRAQVIGAAEIDVAAQVLESLERKVAVDLLHRIEPDDVSDLLQHMDDEVADELLAAMRGKDRSEVEELHQYDSESAGGIMSPRFFALHRDLTASDAIAKLQHVHDELEMVFYVYVVNEVGQLLGVVSLRQLVTAKADTTLLDLMTAEIVSVRPEEDQEEVAKIASRYGLLAVPVVDDSNKLIGIVTVDDVIDVLREEATEDILRMAGAGDELALHENMWKVVLRRVPWLLIAGLSGLVGAALLAIFAQKIKHFMPIVALVPFVLSLSGIAGLQSATIVGQQMLAGRLTRHLLKNIFLQASIGSLLGLLFGGFAASVYFLWGISGGPGNADIILPQMGALIIGVSVAAAIAGASTLGACLPLFFWRIRVDPALAAGPIGAITFDLLALFLFLFISSLGF